MNHVLLQTLALSLLLSEFPRSSFAQIQYTAPAEAFPLAIGNRWYFRHHEERLEWGVYTLNTTISITREIVDTTADGTRLVRVLEFSGLKEHTEHWSYAGINVPFPDPHNPVDSTLWFIPAILWDSRTITPGYTPGVIHLFGSDYVSYAYKRVEQSPVSAFTSLIAGASGIGIFRMLRAGDASGIAYTYSEDLVGMSLGGVVYGDTTLLRTALEPEDQLPAHAGLDQNYPNPFNPSTTIRYTVPRRSHVLLTVFNPLGQQVASLVNGTQEAGFHNVLFDGSGLASGVYFYRLQAGGYVATKKLVVIR